MTIHLERAYDDPEDADGDRVLVDRFWPRGVSKEDADLDEWQKEVAPSDELREWFDHDPERWHEFRERYHRELEDNPEEWRPIAEAARKGRGTLVYAASDRDHNNAVALKEFLEGKLEIPADPNSSSHYE